MRILKQWGSKCSLLVLDWLSIASPLRFALARKIWRQILEEFFGAIFHAMRDRNLHLSFVISFRYSQNKDWMYLAVDTNNFNKI